MFDLVIRGGTVVDGSGDVGHRADVGVTGEVIVAIGDLSRAEAGRVIEAPGLTVAPGFIDTHTHAEGALLVDPRIRWACGRGSAADKSSEFLVPKGIVARWSHH